MQRILTVPMGLCLLVQQLLLPNCHAKLWLRSNVLLSLKTNMGSIAVNVVNIWRTTLERLETAPIDAVCKAWLQSAHLTNAQNIGADDIDAASLSASEEALYFTLQVPSTLARDVIITRWRRSIEDVLADVTGQPVAIVVTNGFDEGLPHRDAPGAGGRDMNGQVSSSVNYAYYD